MANDLTTTTAPANRPTRWSAPQLPASLAKILGDKRLWSDGAALPALSAEERAAAEAALVVYAEAPKGSSPDRISACVGEASAVMARRRETDSEADLRLDIYERELADIDSDVLAAAFRQAIRTLKFFPTIAEIRDIATRLPAPPRVWVAWRLRQLLRVPAPIAPEDLADPDEVQQLIDGVSLAA